MHQNYVYRNHTDVEKVGLLVVPSKTRCGVKKPDYPHIRDKCYCLEKKPGPERSDAGFGVKNGFWHKMEVLSLPWHNDLFWPNTTMFQVGNIPNPLVLNLKRVVYTITFMHFWDTQ